MLASTYIRLLRARDIAKNQVFDNRALDNVLFAHNNFEPDGLNKCCRVYTVASRFLALTSGIGEADVDKLSEEYFSSLLSEFQGHNLHKGA